MPTPYDYFQAGTKGLADANEALVPRVRRMEPATPMEKYVAAIAKGLITPKEAAVRMIHGIDPDDTPNETALADLPPDAQPHYAMGVPNGSLSEQAMQMANQPPQGLAQGAAALPGAPPTVSIEGERPTVGRPMTATVREGPSAPAMPEVKTRGDYEDFMGGAEKLAGMREKGLSLEDRIRMQMLGEQIKQPGRVEVANIQAGTRKEIAGASNQTQRDVAKMTVQQRADEEAGRNERQRKELEAKEKADKEKAVNEQKRLINDTKRADAYARYIDSQVQGKDIGKDMEKLKEMGRNVRGWRDQAALLRRPVMGASKSQRDAASKAADNLERKAEKYEKILIERYGLDFSQFDGGGGTFDPDAVNTPGGMSIQPDVLQRYNLTPDDLGTTGGGPRMNLDTEVQEADPDELGGVEYRRTKDGKILAKLPDGSIVRVG